MCHKIQFFDLNSEGLGELGFDTQYGVSELSFVVEYEWGFTEEILEACLLRRFLHEHSSSYLNDYRLSGPLTRTKAVHSLWSEFKNSGRLREGPCHDHTLQREVAHVIICTNGMDGFLKPQYVPKLFDASRGRLWLKKCMKEHGSVCNQEVPAIEGMRLVDCERLLVIDTEPSRAYAWLALSYVWGGPDLTQLPETPRTITDAITVTKQLGYRYLWVDQYCIDQED